MADPSPKYKGLRRAATAWAWIRERSTDWSAVQFLIAMGTAIGGAVASLVGVVRKAPGPAWVVLYAVLMAVAVGLFVSSTVGLLQTRAKRRKKEGSSPPSAPASPAPTSKVPSPTEPPAERPAEQEAPRKGPELVGDRWVVSVTPQDLSGFFRDHMEIQARKLVEPFMNKWMRISGVVEDVGEEAPGHVWVRLKGDDPAHPMIHLYFSDPKWLEHIRVFQRGDPIKAVGRIDRVGQIFLVLDDCELVP